MTTFAVNAAVNPTLADWSVLHVHALCVLVYLDLL